MGKTEDFVLRSDADILRCAMRDAVDTSPGSFLRTVPDVDAEPPEYWVNEIRSSKWAVVQHGGKVVGIAAGKRPNRQMDSEDPATARYLESVWITPGLRRRQLGERLIKYLLTAEYLDNHSIRPTECLASRNLTKSHPPQCVLDR